MGDSWSDQACCDLGPVGLEEDGGDDDGDEHEGDAGGHDAFEDGKAASADEDEAEDAAGDAVDCLARGGVFEHGGEGLDGCAAGADEGLADDVAEGDEVDAEDDPEGTAEADHGAFEDGLAGGDLPAGEVLVEYELEACADEDDPEDGVAEFASGEACGGQVTGADAGGSDEEAGSDDGEDAAFLHEGESFGGRVAVGLFGHSGLGWA